MLKRVMVVGAVAAAFVVGGCASSTGASAEDCQDTPYGPGCNEGRPVENDADRAADEQRQHDTEVLRKACDNLGGDC